MKRESNRKRGNYSSNGVTCGAPMEALAEASGAAEDVDG